MASADKKRILLVGANGVGKSDLKKSLREANLEVKFLETDEDGNEDEREQYEAFLENANLVLVVVGRFIRDEDGWMIKKAVRESRKCWIVRPKANLETDMWCDRLFGKGWESLDSPEKSIVEKAVCGVVADDAERVREVKQLAKDVPIYLVNGRSLSSRTEGGLPCYDGKQLLSDLKAFVKRG